MAATVIQSSGDLEIILLHEAHDTLASIIGPHLYTVLGDAPRQEIRFANVQCFDLFLIRLIEIFAEGHNVVTIDGRPMNLGLLDGLEWLDDKLGVETEICGLNTAVATLRNWLSTETKFEVWCPEIDRTVNFPVTRRDLVWFGANHVKHHLLRLSGVLGKLARRLEKAGIVVSHQHTVHVLDVTIEEIRSRLIYHSTFIIELLGDVFISLNRLIAERFASNPTNRVDRMLIPEGVSSDVFRNLYGDVLVFKRYEECDSIRAFIPVTNPDLQRKY